MLRILGIKFRVYQFSENLYLQLLYSYGVYILCDEKYKPIYVGMSIKNVGRRIYTHQRKNWNIGFILISEISPILLKEYVKSKVFSYKDDKEINEFGLCHLIITGYESVNRKQLLKTEKRLIKELRPMYNIEHNRHGRK